MSHQLNIFSDVGGDKLRKYHLENPHLFKAFEEMALAEANINERSRYEAKLIFGRLRYETPYWAEDQNFKIDNEFTAQFARVFMTKYPHLSGFFQIRKSKFDNQTHT